ncbi:hypothetical protein [Streptomyces sp. NPDC053720]|uniref:hypothetical protein n=1 Tax=Streptomyces sp. NPDC053720 TaxID=3154855 RepID=UPI003421B628
MWTTTTYTTWVRVMPELSPRETILSFYSSEAATEGEVDEATKAYVQALDAALPERIDLIGEEFVGPAHESDRPWQGEPLDLIRQAVESVDLGSMCEPITQRHRG